MKEEILAFGSWVKLYVYREKKMIFDLWLSLAPLPSLPEFSPLPLKLIKEPQNPKTQKVSACYKDRITIDTNSISYNVEITINNYYYS